MKICLSLFILLLPALSLAQQGYQIDFQIEGLSDTTTYLGYYYGEGTYLKDTATIDGTGRFSFEGKDKLSPGIYFTVLDKTRLFDFIIGENQSFKISSNQKDYIQHLQSLNDPENEVFFSHMKFIYENNRLVQPYLNVLKDSTANDSAKQLAREKAQEIDDRVQSYQKTLIEKNSNLLATKLIIAQQAVMIPKEIQQDRQKALGFYRDHFWDGFDLSDDALLRFPQPIYRQKVEEYLGNLFPQHPDTLMKVINPLIEKARKNPETYKYLVWNLVLNYQYPKIMGLDAIFVQLYDQYFVSGEMDYWANDKLKENLKTRADQLRNTLIGKPAPNLVIQDLKGEAQALEAVKSKYTIIYFYDPDCGFCKKETPKLRDFKNSTGLDVSIYAVCADSSLTKMTKYIEEMEIDDWINVNGPRTYTQHYKTVYDADTTPTIYLLNERRKIIAKKIGADRIQAFLEDYEKNVIVEPTK